jgi:hypothetical protein
VSCLSALPEIAQYTFLQNLVRRIRYRNIPCMFAEIALMFGRLMQLARLLQQRDPVTTVFNDIETLQRQITANRYQALVDPGSFSLSRTYSFACSLKMIGWSQCASCPRASCVGRIHHSLTWHVVGGTVPE